VKVAEKRGEIIFLHTQQQLESALRSTESVALTKIQQSQYFEFIESHNFGLFSSTHFFNIET